MVFEKELMSTLKDFLFYFIKFSGYIIFSSNIFDLFFNNFSITNDIFSCSPDRPGC